MEDHEHLPDDFTELGYLRISLMMRPEGLGTVFTYDGMSLETAIGHLTVVLDRMRQEAAADWPCACCDSDDEDE